MSSGHSSLKVASMLIDMASSISQPSLQDGSSNCQRVASIPTHNIGCQTVTLFDLLHPPSNPSARGLPAPGLLQTVSNDALQIGPSSFVHETSVRSGYRVNTDLRQSGLAHRPFINFENSQTSFEVQQDDSEPIPMSSLKPKWTSIIGHQTKTETPAPTSCETTRRFERWTEFEDEMLLKAVMETGGRPYNFTWKKIATQCFCDSRTDRQCRSRWTRIVDPRLNLAAWTEQEDTTIIQLKQQLGVTFSDIARQLPGRIPEAVRDHWIRKLDPDITKLRWTQQEKESLFTKVKTHGTKWKLIAQLFPGRSEISCKNIWFNKIQSEQRQEKKRAKNEQKKKALGVIG
jgi:hypothetical protein